MCATTISARRAEPVTGLLSMLTASHVGCQNVASIIAMQGCKSGCTSSRRAPVVQVRPSRAGFSADTWLHLLALCADGHA